MGDDLEPVVSAGGFEKNDLGVREFGFDRIWAMCTRSRRMGGEEKA